MSWTGRRKANKVSKWGWMNWWRLSLRSALLMELDLALASSEQFHSRHIGALTSVYASDELCFGRLISQKSKSCKRPSPCECVCVHLSVCTCKHTSGQTDTLQQPKPSPSGEASDPHRWTPVRVRAAAAKATGYTTLQTRKSCGWRLSTASREPPSPAVCQVRFHGPSSAWWGTRDEWQQSANREL